MSNDATIATARPIVDLLWSTGAGVVMESKALFRIQGALEVQWHASRQQAIAIARASWRIGVMGNGMVSDIRRSPFFIAQLKLLTVTMIVFSSPTFCCSISSSDSYISCCSVTQGYCLQSASENTFLSFDYTECVEAIFQLLWSCS